MADILFVEDDPLSLTLSLLVIKKASYDVNVLTATNGKEALDVFKNGNGNGVNGDKGAPQIIFLDLTMPVMDGWGFLDAFDKNHYPKHPETQVHILTSSVDPMDEVKSRQYDCVKGFISKPLTEKKLREVLNGGD